jgi:hypothetical protein
MESTLVDKVAQVAVEVQVLLALSLELRIILEQVVAVEEHPVPTQMRLMVLEAPALTL